MPQANIYASAEQLYRRYTRQTNNKTWDGRECPAWADLPKGVQQAWIAVADEASMMHSPPEDYMPPHPEVLPPPRESRPVGPNGE